MRTLAVLALVAILGSGCASTALTVNLDLYRDDSRGLVVELTPTRIVRLTTALSSAIPEAESLAADRIALASALFDTYEAFYKLTAKKPYNPADLSILRRDLANYQAAVETQRRATQTHLANAQAKLAEYVTRRESGASGTQLVEIEVLQAVGDAARSLSRLGGPLDTNFEQSLGVNWNVVMRSVSADNLRVLLGSGPEPPEMEEVRTKVTALGGELKRLRERGRRVPGNVVHVLEGALKEVQPDPGRLKQSLDQVAAAMTAVPVSLGLSDRGAAALHDLALSSTLLASQLDRLQDPADPVWRVITAPENEGRWNTTFAETYFYSEGNNSVVVVRDTPFSFRVQKGTNNPVALVQGQLQISRAIANAAIAVAGAAAGVPVPKLPGAGGAPAPADPDVAESEQIAKRKAKIERQAALRAGAIAGLRRQLGVIRGQLDRVDKNNRPEIDALLQQMRSILEAYETALK